MTLFLFIVIIVLITYIFGKKDSKKNNGNYDDEVNYLKTAIYELSVILRDSPGKLVKELLEDYKVRLNKLGGAENKIEIKKEAIDPGVSWSHWYSNNSINLLLYIGAFLIIASASIFVGFQWGVLSGTIKAAVLTLVTISFLGFGIWFFNIPKIRNAGNTFIAIAALLIPVCGSAWYNFVFKEAGISLGPVWFMTSVISLGIYIFLTYQYKNRFYTYISSLTSLSLTFSLVNTFNLNSNFYILAGIFTSFILLLSSFIFRNQNKELQDFTLVPLEVSAQIMMPIILFYGLFIVTGQHKLDTLEAVFSIFLASGFYVLSYLHFKKIWYIAASQILCSFGIILFCNWQKLDKSLLLYAVDICALTYIYLAYFMRNLKLIEEHDLSIALGLIQLILVFIFSLSLGIEPIHRIFLALSLVAAGIGVSYIKNDVKFIGISTFFTAIALYILYADIIKLTHKMEFLGVVYFLIGVLFYTIIICFNKMQGITKVFGLSAGLFFFLAIIFSYGVAFYVLVLSLLISGVAAHAAWRFEKSSMIYVSNAFIVFSLFNLLRNYNVSSNFYPFIYATISYIFYGISIFVDKRFQEAYTVSGLVGAVITPILFGFNSTSHSGKILQRNAIMTAYAATALYGFDVFWRKVPNFGYITSVLGMITYLWQIKYFNITESLIYTIPLGVYFLVLAYTRKIKGDKSGRQVFDFLGLFFLLMSPLLLSFGNEAMKYSVVLGFLGIILLGVGITISYKLYWWGGIAGIVFAVIPQTYNYILALPRWMVVGIFGLIFIIVAIFLLLRRKEIK